MTTEAEPRELRAAWLVLARLLPATKKPLSRSKLIASVAGCLGARFGTEAAKKRAEEGFSRCLAEEWLVAAPLRLTPKGQAELERALGVHPLPAVKGWTDVRRRLLVPLALERRELPRSALDSDQVAAQALAAEHGLAPSASLRATVDRLAWRALGRETDKAFSAGAVQRYLLRQLVPEDARVELKAWRRLLAVKALGAARSDGEALRSALIARWAGADPGRSQLSSRDHDSPASRAAPRPDESAPAFEAGRATHQHSASGPQDDPLAAFARAVVQTARLPEVSKFHEDRAFIASVWERMRGKVPVREMSLAEFKQKLVAAHRAGHLTMTRADLITAMDPIEVQKSEAEYLGARFHFVALDAGGAP